MKELEELIEILTKIISTEDKPEIDQLKLEIPRIIKDMDFVSTDEEMNYKMKLDLVNDIRQYSNNPNFFRSQLLIRIVFLKQLLKNLSI